jgi:hypothetical protein
MIQIVLILGGLGTKFLREEFERGLTSSGRSLQIVLRQLAARNPSKISVSVIFYRRAIKIVNFGVAPKLTCVYFKTTTTLVYTR